MHEAKKKAAPAPPKKKTGHPDAKQDTKLVKDLLKKAAIVIRKSGQ